MMKFKLVLSNDDQDFVLYDEQKEIVLEGDYHYRINQAIEIFENTLKYLNIEYLIETESE